MRNLQAAACAIGLMIPCPVNGQSVESGRSICYEIERMVNGVIDFTKTSCVPGAGRARGTVSFILISSEPVFSIPAAKKAWIVVAVAAAAQAVSAASSARGDALWLSDAAHMANRTAWALPVSAAQDLQANVKSGRLDLEGMYSEINRALQRVIIPAR